MPFDYKPPKMQPDSAAAMIVLLGDFGGKTQVGAHHGPNPNYVARVVRPFFKEQAWVPLTNDHWPFPVYACGVRKSHAAWLMNPNPTVITAEVK
jgi:hypothetical protein